MVRSRKNKDLIRKKFEKNRRKKAEKIKNKKKKTRSKSPKRKKKNKKKEHKKRYHSSSSSSSDEESDNSNRNRLKAVQSKLAVAAANIDKKYRMAGALMKKPENPPNFPREMMRAEWQEMNTSGVSIDQIRTLDEYLKNRAELKSTDHVVISETVDDDDKKATSRLKILTKFDEGRFGAIYIVQNEAAVEKDVVSVGSGRFMMKTALRLLSSNQINYRLTREINTLKGLWSKPNDQPTRLPPVYHDGRILGVPFYVTQMYDINLEKCREEMGGCTFSLGTVFHVAQEILTAIRFLHRRQYVHRDIKPTNIAFSLVKNDQWFLMDFGDCVAAGRTSVLGPPDGLTLPFLSREAHEVLGGGIPTTFQQDLESWWLMLVDMYKPLPWRETIKVDSVLREKREFFKSPPSDLPTQLAEIQKLLKSDPPYKEIGKHVADGLTAGKNSSWFAEWLDRPEAKRRAQKQAAAAAKKAEETVNATTADDEAPAPANRKKDGSIYVSENEGNPAVTPKVKLPSGRAAKKDRSIYVNENEAATKQPSVMDDNQAPAAQPIRTPRMKKSREYDVAPVTNKAPSIMDDTQAPPAQPVKTPRMKKSRECDAFPGANKVASVMDDTEAPPPAAPVVKDRSVYFKDFPVASMPDNNRRRYRYKPKNK